MVEVHVIFKGKVQGVGFRWTILDHAEKHKVQGTAQNLKNGTVEVFASGAKETLEAFIKAILQDPGSARIDSILTDYKQSQKNYFGFHIIY